MAPEDKAMLYSEIKSVNNATIDIDKAQGIVEAFAAAIGNKDSVGDVIIPGAFAKSLKHRKPRVVWGHDWNSPIGKVLEIEEVPPSDPRIPEKMRAMGVGGLYVKVQFNLGSARGKEAFNDVMFYGVEQEWSIGYKTIRKGYDAEKQANILQEVELYEVSPVLHGANNLTSTISIKEAIFDDSQLSTSAMSISGSTGGTAWTGGYSWNPGTDSSPWDFSMTDKSMMPHVSTDLVVQRETEMSPHAMKLMKLRKAFTSAFGPFEDLKLMDDNQVVFKKQDGTWMVKYRIEGSKLIVTRPKRVRVRTIIEPIEDVAKEPTQVPVEGGEEDMMRKRGFSDSEPEIEKSGEPDGLEDKAGRVISQGNMSKLKKAADMIQEVISSGAIEPMKVDARPMIQKKDGQSLMDAYKTAEHDENIIVVKGDSLLGKTVRLTSKEDVPSMEKVFALVNELVPLAEKHGWTLLAPSQKSVEDGTCSLGIHFSSEDDMPEQVKSLSDALKLAECSVNIEVEVEDFYSTGPRAFEEVFSAE